MKYRNRITVAGIAVALAGATFLGAATPAYAVNQSDVDAAASKLSELGTQLSQIQSELDDASEDLAQTSIDLAEKQDQVAATQEELSAKRKELSGLMRSNYKLGTNSLLDFILGSTSIDDLVSRVFYMDKISERRVQVIVFVKTMEEKLKTEKAELESKQAEQTEKVASLQSQANDYGARVGEASSYYNSLDAELQAQLAAAATTEQSAAATAVAAVQQAAEQQQAAQTAAASVSEETEQKLKKQEESEVPTTTTTTSTAAESKIDAKDDSASNDASSSLNSSGSSSYGGGGVSTALAQQGKPYVYGAAGPGGFDCSGLVCYSYGYSRGRTTYDMISSLQASGSWKTDISQLSYGDLVFTSEGHVGIYLGSNTMVHAPKPGSSVCTTTLWSFYGGGSY
ncbi:NlpC/P60 family protein [Paratractidigestivibacter sp.]|uniref:C40 family peptidase n=1 Tax=Paratractidigestivibacter sp. TaxID=2847316 RepID=UPI002AC89FE9|nr:NlpC/P60 family protein [Paratractidigestivibacter sp.]